VPELPEVETVVRGLRKTLVGCEIMAVESRAPRNSVVISGSFRRGSLSSLLTGRRIIRIDRSGKNILIRLNDDTTLWVHLKMTGKFRYVRADSPVDRHDLVLFELSANADSKEGYHLRFNDYRRFGRLRLYRNEELAEQKSLCELGAEPLEMSPTDFVELCHRRGRMIKPALLDQSFIAGLGNIYADESLWSAKIHPQRLTNSISKIKLVELHSHIQRILRRAIKLQGSTVSSYSGVGGQSGKFQKCLQVYGREDEDCRSCGSRIVRMKIGSRSAHFCRRCQRAAR